MLLQVWYFLLLLLIVKVLRDPWFVGIPKRSGCWQRLEYWQCRWGRITRCAFFFRRAFGFFLMLSFREWEVLFEWGTVSWACFLTIQNHYNDDLLSTPTGVFVLQTIGRRYLQFQKSRLCFFFGDWFKVELLAHLAAKLYSFVETVNDFNALESFIEFKFCKVILFLYR